MDNFDIVIVGAGTSGAIAARFAASSGLKVCLVDALKKDKIGDKICGDVVLATIFDFLNIDHPKEKEIMSMKKSIRVYSSDLLHYLKIDIPVYLVDRISFGQKLLNDALDAGVKEFLDNTKVMDLTYKNGNVNGIMVRSKNREKTAIRAKIVIDGSGAHSILRSQIKSDIIPNEIEKNDFIICYRQIVKFDNSNGPNLPTDSLTVAFDPDNVPGGFFWYFPKSETISNLGAGVFLRHKSAILPIYSDYVIKKFLSTRNYKILSSGGDIVPVRRPISSCSDNGIMFIGDAACHVNNASGGGIHMGMKAGYYAAMIAKKAIDAEDYTLNKLWDYNCLVMNDFGVEHAAIDVARIILQYMKTKDFDFIIKRKLLNDQELNQMYYSRMISPSIGQLILKFMKGISKPQLLLKLNYLLKQMKTVRKHYLIYPQDASGYESWRQTEKDIFHKLFLKVASNG
jgi:digeranylgeranylglycerophospholipid reductase